MRCLRFMGVPQVWIDANVLRAVFASMIVVVWQGNFGKGNLGLGNVGFGSSVQNPELRQRSRHMLDRLSSIGKPVMLLGGLYQARPARTKKLNAELANGRLAMMAIIGMCHGRLKLIMQQCTCTSM